MSWTAVFPGPLQARNKSSIKAPPSKSMTHRMLICAGLAEGTSRIRGAAVSQDILATLDCLRAIGAVCRVEASTDQSVDISVTGTDIFHIPEGAVLPCRESGSTLRFLLPSVLLGGRSARMTGSGRLMERPLSVYESLCREKDLLFDKKADSLLVRGPLKAGSFVIPGNISSQFVSGLLIALPLLEEDSSLQLLPPVESGPYIEMTIAAMKRAGVTVEKTDALTFRIPGKQKYRPCVQAVEGDWSNAASLLAMGIRVDGLDVQSLQGDRCCLSYLSQLKKGYARLDLSDCPDLGPVLFAFAALHHGGCFTGVRRLRDKESDRIAAMAAELSLFGVRTCQEENTFVVTGGVSKPGAVVDGHNDHRIVMALSVLCAAVGGRITGAEAVKKSWPDYFDRLKDAGINCLIVHAASEDVYM